MGSGAATYEVGVTSTPVIDPAAGLLYVVDQTTGKHVLHALSLTTGQDAVTPAVVAPPTGFTSNIQLNRPGLLFLNGVVYIAFGSHCDAGSYHGWVFGHDAMTLALKSLTRRRRPPPREPSGKAGSASRATATWRTGRRAAATWG